MTPLSHVNPKALVPTPEDYQCDDGNGWAIKWSYLGDFFRDVKDDTIPIKKFHMGRPTLVYPPDNRNVVSSAHHFWECT